VNFRLGSIPIRVRPEFFILAIWGALNGSLELGLLWVAIVFVSVLGHELGHALAMRLFGYAPSIELHGLGGRTLWPNGARPSEKQRLLVTLAGPGIELVAGIAVYYGLLNVTLSPLAAWARDQFVWVNIVWAMVNLAPILPWDGGLVLDSGLALITGKSRARGVGLISVICGAVAIGAAFYLGYRQYFMLLYLGGIGIWKGWQRWSGNEPGRVPPEAETAWNLSAQGQHAQAEALLGQALSGTRDVATRAHLLEVLAWVRLSANDPNGAERALIDMGELASRTSPELRARLAAHRQQPHRVVELLAPLAAAQRLRPEAWPLLISAIDDPERRAALLSESVSRLALSPPEQELALGAAEKLFHGGHVEAALVLCQRAFEVCRAPVFAFNAACCLCRLGRVDEGLEWLTTAVTAGYRSSELLDDDPDLAPLRAHPAFAALRDAARAS
jgi:hypothetical protein